MEKKEFPTSVLPFALSLRNESANSNLDIMDSLEPRLKRCRSCGACSETMSKCQTCKNHYQIKWSESHILHIFALCVLSPQKYPSCSNCPQNLTDHTFIIRSENDGFGSARWCTLHIFDCFVKSSDLVSFPNPKWCPNLFQ
jgi:hypothetical protein